jgi:hypothetical protein
MLVGVVLLLFGRRLYWLFVAGVGFLTGLELAPRLLPGRSEWVVLVTALGLALLGTILAIVAQKFIIALVGLVAGGGIGVLLLRMLGLEGGDLLTWVVYAVAGLLGVLIVLSLFEWGLILLSSLAGANLIIVGVQDWTSVSQGVAFVVMIAVAIVGVVVQASCLGAAPRRRRPAPRA